MDELDTGMVAAARSGDSEALERLFAACGPRLLGYIRLRLGRNLRQRLESRDILQSTLLKAFTAVSTVEAGSRTSLLAWLAAIADNEIRDQAAFHGRQRRAMNATQGLDSGLEAVLATPVRTLSAQLVLAEDSARLEAALEELSDDHREVILLRYFHGLSFADIGRRLGRSADASRMLLARAMAALTVHFEGEP